MHPSSVRIPAVQVLINMPNAMGQSDYRRDMAPKVILTSAARIWVDDEGILNVVSLGVRSTAESGQEFLAATRELLGDQRAALLLDAREWPGGTPSSWSQFISMLESMFLAGAVIANPLATERMGVFPQIFDGMLVPFRVFDAEEPARAFLRQHLDDHP